MHTFNRGTVRICCDSDLMNSGGNTAGRFEETWNNELWKSVRRSFLDDKPHRVCNICWNKEKNGIKSFRDPRRQQELLAKTNPDGSMQSGPEEIAIRLGNECNLRCVMCTPHNSTQWYKDQKVYKKHVDSLFGDEIKVNFLNEGSWNYDVLKSAKRIQFAGGEPLIIKSHYKILDKLIEMGRANDVELSYYTNGTIFPKDLIERAIHFKDIHLNISIDGIKEQYNYIRYPGKWNQVESIVRLIDQENLPNLNLRIVEVYFFLTAFSVESLFDWRDSVNFKKKPDVILQDLSEPEFFDVRHYPQFLKDRWIASLKSLETRVNDGYEYDSVKAQRIRLEAPFETLPGMFEKLQKFLNDLDLNRKIDHRLAYPDISWKRESPLWKTLKSFFHP